MKKYTFHFGLLVSFFVLTSWGVAGHRTIARIAQNHLNQKAKMSVAVLFGARLLEDECNYADDILLTPEYSNTLPLHYLNVPAGLSFQKFKSFVVNDKQPNIYNALNEKIDRLKSLLNSGNDSLNKSKDEQTECLKWIINLVADAHQPTHVGPIDITRTGSAVSFNGVKTNLNSLWENRLIDAQKTSYPILAKDADHASSEQAEKWQNDDIISWLYESYELDGELNNEVKNNSDLTDTYLSTHLTILQKRLDQAGLRLAGLLNAIFSEHPVIGDVIYTVRESGLKSLKYKVNPKSVEINDVSNYIGQQPVQVCSKVFGHKEIGNMTFVYLGGKYPAQMLTVVLKDEAKDCADYLYNKEVCIMGQVISFEGKPAIIVTQPQNIKYLPKSSDLIVIHDIDDGFIASSYNNRIDIKDVNAHLNQVVSLSGKAFGHKSNDSSVLVYIGGKFPNQLLIIELKGESVKLAEKLDGKTISVMGTIVMRNEPIIEITDPRQISILKNSSQ